MRVGLIITRRRWNEIQDRWGVRCFLFHVTFTSYQTIPYKFFEHMSTLGDIESLGYSTLGDYGDIDRTMIYLINGIEVIGRLRDNDWRFSWSSRNIFIRDIVAFMNSNNDFRLSEVLSDMLPFEEEDDEEDGGDDLNEKKKTIRKSSRDKFLEEFNKLVEAPDSEYTCLICLTDKSDEVLDPAKVLMTACGHLFHRFCIKEWVKSASTELTGYNRCPACRTEIVAFHGPDSTLNSQETDAVQTPKE